MCICTKSLTATATRMCSTSALIVWSSSSMATMLTQTIGGILTISSSFLQLSSFSLNYLGEFCFIIWPFQPPSIRPISSNFSDNTIYFLVSIDFVSHNTISSILRVSTFLIENWIHGSLLSLFKKLAIDTPSIVSTNNESIFNPSVYLWDFGNVL